MLCLVSGGPATLSGRDSSPSSRNDSSWRWSRLASGYAPGVPVPHEMALPTCCGSGGSLADFAADRPILNAEVSLDLRLYEQSLVGVAQAGEQVGLPPFGQEGVQPVSGCRSSTGRDGVLGATQLLYAIRWYASDPKPRHRAMSHAQLPAADDQVRGIQQSCQPVVRHADADGQYNKRRQPLHQRHVAVGCDCRVGQRAKQDEGDHDRYKAVEREPASPDVQTHALGFYPYAPWRPSQFVGMGGRATISHRNSHTHAEQWSV